MLYMCIDVYVYIYIYTERERERTRERCIYVYVYIHTKGLLDLALDLEAPVDLLDALLVDAQGLEMEIYYKGKSITKGNPL